MKIYRNVEEIIIATEKIKTSVIKMKHCKISKLLNGLTVSKFVTKNGSK